MLCNKCNQIIHSPFALNTDGGDNVNHVVCPKKDDVIEQPATDPDAGSDTDTE